jgi:hypothetical protein
MAAGDLTTLDRLKMHLGIEDSSADPILLGLVSAASSDFEGRTDRRIYARSYTETCTGDGRDRLQLLNYPIVSVSSVTVDGETIPERTTVSGSGWTIDGTELVLDGYTFTEGNRNVAISYVAGYAEIDEAATVPSVSPYRLLPSKMFGNDLGVKLAIGGTAMIKVTGSPASGQYAVDSAGLYTFNVAQAGVGVLLSYGTVPVDVVQAVNELAADIYKRRDHIGQRSKVIGGETVTWMVDAIPTYAESVIKEYRRLGI